MSTSSPVKRSARQNQLCPRICAITGAEGLQHLVAGAINVHLEYRSVIRLIHTAQFCSSVQRGVGQHQASFGPKRIAAVCESVDYGESSAICVDLEHRPTSSIDPKTASLCRPIKCRAG